MGTSKTFAELGGKLISIGTHLDDKVAASFRQAARDLAPSFNSAARRAAGPNQAYSGMGNAARLSVEFEVKGGRSVNFLNIKPTGPWGIRDNTDVGGPTGMRTQRPKRVKWLKFRGDGDFIYAKVTRNAGARGPFWGQAREDALPKVRKHIQKAVQEAITAGISGSGFGGRG